MNRRVFFKKTAFYSTLAMLGGVAKNIYAKKTLILSKTAMNDKKLASAIPPQVKSSLLYVADAKDFVSVYKGKKKISKKQGDDPEKYNCGNCSFYKPDAKNSGNGKCILIQDTADYTFLVPKEGYCITYNPKA